MCGLVHCGHRFGECGRGVTRCDLESLCDPAGRDLPWRTRGRHTADGDLPDLRDLVQRHLRISSGDFHEDCEPSLGHCDLVQGERDPPADHNPIS